MLFPRLLQYADEHGIEPLRVRPQIPGAIVALDADGTLFDVEVIEDRSRKSAAVPVLMPETRRTSGIETHLLADKVDYTFGHGSKGSVAKRHAAYLDALDDYLAKVDDPDARVVRDFLGDPRLDDETLARVAKADGPVIFEVDAGDYVHEHPEALAFHTRLGAPAGDPRPCQTCGKLRPPADAPIRLPLSPASASATLVTANFDAFTSYGQRKGGAVGAMCYECMLRSHRALRRLLSDERYHHYFQLGDDALRAVFWAVGRDEAADLVREVVDDPPDLPALRPADVRHALASVWKPKAPPRQGDTTRVSMVLLQSRNGEARVPIHEWIDVALPNLRESLTAWYADMLIGREPRLVSIGAMAANLVPKLGRKLSAAEAGARRRLIQQLLRAAVTGRPGQPLPREVLTTANAQALSAVARGYPAVNHTRAAIFALYLRRKGITVPTTHDDTTHDHPTAFLCGRLLAQLSRSHYLAMQPSHTTADRFYANACRRPRRTFGTLLTLARPHFAKAGGENRARAIANQIEAAGGFPERLGPEEQAVFHLGWFAEREHIFGSKNGSYNDETEQTNE